MEESKTIGGSGYVQKTVMFVAGYEDGTETVYDSASNSMMTFEGGVKGFIGADLDLYEKVRLIRSLDQSLKREIDSD